MTFSQDISLTPQIIRKGNQPEYAVLPWDQFKVLLDRLDDLEDLVIIHRARAEDDGSTISHEQLKRELGLE